MEYTDAVQLQDDFSKSISPPKENSLSMDDSYNKPNELISEEISKIEEPIIKKRKNPSYCQHKKWTIEEDLILRRLIIEFGENDWRHLAKKMENRNPRQCRERWQNYLSPNIKIGQWTQEEDELIFKKREELGPKWILIAKFFENRTDGMIKTRYNALIRERTKKNKTKSDGSIVLNLSVKKQRRNKKNDKSKQSNVTEQIIEPLNYMEYFTQKENNDDFFSKEDDYFFDDQYFTV